MPEVSGYLVIIQGLGNPVGLVSHHGVDNYAGAQASMANAALNDIASDDFDSIVAIIPAYAISQNTP